MGFWSRLVGIERRNAPITGPLELLRHLLTGYATKAGTSITTEKAMAVSGILAGVRVLGEDVSGLPLKLYQSRGSKRVLLPDDAIQRVLDFPNDWQTGNELREQLTIHAVLTGSGLAWKNIVRGEVVELLPLLPGWYTTEQAKDWGLVHKVRLPDGTRFDLRGDQVLHVRGPSWNGYTGLEIFRLAREAIGLSMAAEESQSRLHSNSLQTSGLYSVDGTLDEDDYASLRAHIEKTFGGEENRFKPMILDRNAKYVPVTMTGVDAQHIETRKFQLEEVGRFLRVFPQMIGHSDKTATFASAEAFFQAHAKFGLMPWVNRWEGAIRRDLIGRDRARAGVYVKHSMAAMERADIKTRYTAYGQGIKDGWLVRNEARAFEDMDELEGLDEPLQPLNMATQDQAAAAAVAEQDEQPPGGQPTKGRRPFGPELRDFDPSRHPRDENGKFKGRGAGRRRVRRMARRAIADKRHQETLDLGSVERPELSHAAGRNVHGWRLTVNSDQVRHIHGEHGSWRTERARGQLPVTPDDYGRLRALVHGQSTVSRGGLTRAQSLQTVHVSGVVGNARYEAVLTVNKRTRMLRVHTLFKKPK